MNIRHGHRAAGPLVLEAGRPPVRPLPPSSAPATPLRRRRAPRLDQRSSDLGRADARFGRRRLRTEVSVRRSPVPGESATRARPQSPTVSVITALRRGRPVRRAPRGGSACRRDPRPRRGAPPPADRCDVQFGRRPRGSTATRVNRLSQPPSGCERRTTRAYAESPARDCRSLATRTSTSRLWHDKLAVRVAHGPSSRARPRPGAPGATGSPAQERTGRGGSSNSYAKHELLDAPPDGVLPDVAHPRELRGAPPRTLTCRGPRGPRRRRSRP